MRYRVTFRPTSDPKAVLWGHCEGDDLLLLMYEIMPRYARDSYAAYFQPSQIICEISAFLHKGKISVDLNEDWIVEQFYGKIEM